MTRDWTSVEAEVRRIVAESDPPFTGETIEHANDFLKYLRERTIPPTVKRGYWPTLAIWWDYDAETEPPTSVTFEVFARRIEVYSWVNRGPGLPAALAGIREVPHMPGESYPQEIEADLPHCEAPTFWFAMEIALKMMGLFILAGLAMAAFAFAMSFVIRVDAVHLYVAMFVSLLVFLVIGVFFSARYLLRISRRRRHLNL